jgi:hypothetical protein
MSRFSIDCVSAVASGLLREDVLSKVWMNSNSAERPKRPVCTSNKTTRNAARDSSGRATLVQFSTESGVFDCAPLSAVVEPDTRVVIRRGSLRYIDGVGVKHSRVVSFEQIAVIGEPTV